MQEIGEKFARLEIFLSDLIMAGEAMTSVVEVLRPVLLQKRLATLVAGKIVIGTVQGDIHDIGKNIVAAMLIASGFEVHDLGVDVSPSRLVESAQEEKTDIIGMSALMTTSMPYQEEAIKLLQELGLREEYWVLVGGGPVTDKSAQDMGADGYAKDATEAATAAKKLMSGES
jgi:methylmalonyl-CoA mutase cobalamin-binding domain/chain